MRFEALLDERRDPHKLPGFQGHFHRFTQQALLLIPHTRSAIPRTERLCSKTLPGLGSHGLSKEGMVAVPLPGAIKRLQEETCALHCFEQMLALVTPADCITERTGQATEQTRLEQKDLEHFWLRRQHFGQEELQNRPVATGEARQKLLDLGLCRPALEHEAHQAQPCHPAEHPAIKVADFLS